MNAQCPGDLVALDTVEIRPVGGGAWLFLFTAVDHHSRLAFAMAFPKRNAQCAAGGATGPAHPIVLALLSDNGAEFQADFDCLADRLGLRRFFIFPSCPKQNGRNERFNGARRYGFVQTNEHFADDLPAFNRQLAGFWLAHLVQCPKTPPRPRRKHPLELPAQPPQKRITTMGTPTTICISGAFTGIIRIRRRMLKIPAVFLCPKTKRPPLFPLFWPFRMGQFFTALHRGRRALPSARRFLTQP